MGAVLECCGGPSADYYDAAFLKTSSARYHPLLGRCDVVEKSLLQKLQRSLSTTWSTRLLLGDAVRSPHGLSHASSRYGLDEFYESESDTEDEPSSDTRGSGSVTSATSGSRMLCDFYNLVLECDHSKFFVDAQGRRVKGAYLATIEILDDYFDTTRRTTVGSRRRRRSSVDVLPYQPPQKLKHWSSNPNYDRSSNMSLMSNDTNQTLTSESDYWATFYEDTPNDAIDVGDMSFSSKSDRRRLWFPSEQQPFDRPVPSSLLLFSPVHTTTEAAPLASRPMMQDTTKPLAMPTEGSRYNLWDDDQDTSKPLKNAVVPPAFSSAAVTERRRASITMGSNGNANSSRRRSVHAVAV